MSDSTLPAASRAEAPRGDSPSGAALSSADAPISRMAGLGRVLVAIYLILALAATFRSIYQIVRKFDEAPVAYLLSALAGVVYIVATVALTRKGTAWRRVAWAALSFELAGVLIVGALSFLVPQWFAHPSVWSWFGAGYLFIPLVLPALGLLWLSRSAGSRQAESRQTRSAPEQPAAGAS